MRCVLFSLQSQGTIFRAWAGGSCAAPVHWQTNQKPVPPPPPCAQIRPSGHSLILMLLLLFLIPNAAPLPPLQLLQPRVHHLENSYSPFVSVRSVPLNNAAWRFLFLPSFTSLPNHRGLVGPTCGTLYFHNCDRIQLVSDALNVQFVRSSSLCGSVMLVVTLILWPGTYWPSAFCS